MNTRITKIAIGMAGSIAALCAGSVSAQDVLLNSGYDHSVGAPYAIGTQDNYWIKISSYEPPSPSAPVADADVVQPPIFFEPAAPGTQWLSHDPTMASGSPGGDFKGYHLFRKCFCLIDAVERHQIQFDIRADDDVQVWMNNITNVLVSPQYGRFRQSDPNPISVNVSGQDILKPKTNCIYVLVEDDGGIAGFNLRGRVTGALATPATGPNMNFGPCCDEVNGGRENPPAANTKPSLSAEETKMVADIQKTLSERAAAKK